MKNRFKIPKGKVTAILTGVTSILGLVLVLSGQLNSIYTYTKNQILGPEASLDFVLISLNQKAMENFFAGKKCVSEAVNFGEIKHTLLFENAKNAYSSTAIPIIHSAIFLRLTNLSNVPVDSLFVSTKLMHKRLNTNESISILKEIKYFSTSPDSSFNENLDKMYVYFGKKKTEIIPNLKAATWGGGMPNDCGEIVKGSPPK